MTFGDILNLITLGALVAILGFDLLRARFAEKTTRSLMDSLALHETRLRRLEELRKEEP